MDIEIGQLHLRYAALRVIHPDRVARLAAAVLSDGQRCPVLLGRDNVLIDGYHRVAALREVGRDLVSATVIDVAEPDALVLAWRLEVGRRRSALEEGWLLEELIDAHGRTQAGLATEMHRPRSWISQRLGLVRALPLSAQNAVRDGRVPAQGAMKALVPMARSDLGACEQLVTTLPPKVTVRELDQIYRAWRKADAEGRGRIVANPALLLKVEDAVNEVPPDDEEQLASDFEAIAGLCRRARRRAQGGLFARANSELLRRTWDQATLGFEALQAEVSRAR